MKHTVILKIKKLLGLKNIYIFLNSGEIKKLIIIKLILKYKNSFVKFHKLFIIYSK